MNHSIFLARPILLNNVTFKYYENNYLHSGFARDSSTVNTAGMNKSVLDVEAGLPLLVTWSTPVLPYILTEISVRLKIIQN